MSRPWWEKRWLAFMAVMATALPLLKPLIPPLLDLPGHIGRYDIAATLDRSPFLQRFYDYHWHLIGNLGVDLLVVPLTPLVGVEVATKIVVVAIPILATTGFLLVAGQGHGRGLQATTPLALVFAYAYPLHFGFVNFSLSTALAGLGFALWLRSDGRRDWWRATLFGAVAIIVWVAHAMGWVLLCALCGASELHRRVAARQLWPTLLAGTALSCLPLTLPVLFQLLAPSAGETGGWFDFAMVAKWLLALNRDRWMTLDLLCTAVLLSTLAAAAVRWWGLRFEPRLFWPAMAVVVLAIVTPQTIGGSAFVGVRFIFSAAAFLLLAISTADVNPRRARMLAIIATAFFVIRMAATALSLLLYDHSFTSALRAIDLMPQGARVAVFSWAGCRPTFSNWANGRLEHLGGIAIVRRNAFVNDQWTAQGVQLLTVHHPAAGDFEHSPSHVTSPFRCPAGGPAYVGDQLNRLNLAAFDYVWLLNYRADQRPYRAWLMQVYADQASALYQIKASGGGRFGRGSGGH